MCLVRPVPSQWMQVGGKHAGQGGTQGNLPHPGCCLIGCPFCASSRTLAQGFHEALTVSEQGSVATQDKRPLEQEAVACGRQKVSYTVLTLV